MQMNLKEFYTKYASKDLDVPYYLYVNVANFCFIVDFKSEYIPKDIEDIPVLFEATRSEDDKSWVEYHVGAGHVEAFVNQCHFYPDENPFVLVL